MILTVKYNKDGSINKKCLERLERDFKRVNRCLDICEGLIKDIPNILTGVDVEEYNGYYNMMTEYNGHIVYINDNNIYDIFKDEVQLKIAKESLEYCKVFNKDYDDYKEYLDLLDI